MIEFHKSGRLTKIRFDPPPEPLIRFSDLFPFALAVWKQAAAAGVEFAQFGTAYVNHGPLRIATIRTIAVRGEQNWSGDVELLKFHSEGPERSAELFSIELRQAISETAPVHATNQPR